MYGVTLNGTHYGGTLDCILNYARVGVPEPNLQEIAVPGRNGVLDITDGLGEITYSPRPIDFMFTLASKEKTDRLLNDIHGRWLKVILDRDREYYYEGRCTASSIEKNGPLYMLSGQIKCNPYKLRTRRTAHKAIVNGTQSFILLNSRMPAMPVITASAPMRLEFNRTTYQIPQGTYQAYEILLTHGYNHFTVTGQGSIVLEWQEGTL